MSKPIHTKRIVYLCLMFINKEKTPDIYVFDLEIIIILHTYIFLLILFLGARTLNCLKLIYDN